MSCLRDDALEYYAEQTSDVRSDLYMLVASFKRRFDDRKLPETYRASLPMLKIQSRESLEEFASRVRKTVSKAYPGISGTTLLEDMTIEHLVKGLSDQSLIYDVLTKKPRTVESALDLVQWHESCKNQSKKLGVRQVSFDTNQDVDNASVRRSMVTEERLNQFGRELVNELRKT